MKDQFGTDLAVGNYVVYFSRSGSHVKLIAARVTKTWHAGVEVHAYDEGRFHNRCYNTNLRTPSNVTKVRGFEPDVEAQLGC